MSSAAAEKPKVFPVAPFAIEADHPRNCDLLLQGIPNGRLRGALRSSKPVLDNDGVERTPLDQVRHLGQLPPIPGMQLHVKPKDGSYMIYDPLTEDEALLLRIKRAINESRPYRTGEKLAGVPKQLGTLDADGMKTLVREMLNLVEANEAKLVKGTLPTREEVDLMPGDYLLNPGLRSRTSQPRYEKDLEDYVRGVDHVR